MDRLLFDRALHLMGRLEHHRRGTVRPQDQMDAAALVQRFGNLEEEHHAG